MYLIVTLLFSFCIKPFKKFVRDGFENTRAISPFYNYICRSHIENYVIGWFFVYFCVRNCSLLVWFNFTLNFKILYIAVTTIVSVLVGIFCKCMCGEMDYIKFSWFQLHGMVKADEGGENHIALAKLIWYFTLFVV